MNLLENIVKCLISWITAPLWYRPTGTTNRITWDLQPTL